MFLLTYFLFFIRIAMALTFIFKEINNLLLSCTVHDIAVFFALQMASGGQLCCYAHFTDEELRPREDRSHS